MTHKTPNIHKISNPHIITLSKGSLTESELLNHPNIKPHIRYDTYIRINDVLLTTMFRETPTHKHARDLGSMSDLLRFIEWKVANSSIAFRSGVSIKSSQYTQPIAGMGIISVEDLAQDVFLKLIRQEPKIITNAYLNMTIKCLGIDHKCKAVLRHTSSLSRTHKNTTEDSGDTYEQEIPDLLSLSPEASLVFDRLVASLSPLEAKVLLGLLGKSDGQSLADELGIHRRTIYLVKSRIKAIMRDHL